MTGHRPQAGTLNICPHFSLSANVLFEYFNILLRNRITRNFIRFRRTIGVVAVIGYLGGDAPSPVYLPHISDRCRCDRASLVPDTKAIFGYLSAGKYHRFHIQNPSLLAPKFLTASHENVRRRYFSHSKPLLS